MYTLQPQKYLPKIGTLNNIKFTLREIDVIACVLSGKIAKTMAGILGIETRTYETHYANVKKKLQINTKEHLITLIENYASTLIYKSHASLLQIEKNIFESIQLQTLEHKSFSLHISQNSNQLFFDLLKRHMKLFNISLHIKKTIQKDQHKPLDFIFIPTDSSNISSNTLHVHFQNDLVENSEKNLYFKQDIEYFEFLITTIEKLNPNVNTFYIKQKICNILSKQSEGLLRIQEPVRSMTTRYFPKSLHNISIFQKIWMLIGAITSVTSLTLLVPSISTQAIIQNNLRSMHMFGLNNNILKRDDLLSSIESAFLNQAVETPHAISYVTLVGISGSGKTTLATNYAENQTKKFTWELNAQSYATLRQSYLQLAYSLANTKEKQAQIVFLEAIKEPDVFSGQLLRFIQNNLKEQKDWLLIFDNVINLKEIESLLPHGKNLWGYGNVIITTTNDNLEISTSQNNQYIKVEGLSDIQAKDLFCTIVYKSAYKYTLRTAQQSADALLREIPSFPLDITLAAHYLRHTNSTIQEYITKLHDDGSTCDSLNTFFQQELNTPLARSSLLHMTIQNILRVDKSFQHLLYVVARLNFKNIPRNLLLAYCTEDIVNAFILTLKKYSLITETRLPHVHDGERFISIHPFVQNYCKNYLNKKLDKKLHQDFMHKAVHGVLKYEKSIPSIHYRIRNILKEHIKALLTPSTIIPSYSSMDLYHLYTALGKTYYLGSRELLLAKEAFEMALKHVSKDKVDKDHIELLLILSNICNDIVAPESALLYAQQAIYILKGIKKSPSQSIQYARALFERGIAHLLLNNISGAEQDLHLSLKTLETIASPEALELKSQITAYRGWMTAATNLTSIIGGTAVNDVNEALKMIIDSGTLRLNIKTSAKLRAYHYVTKGDILCKQGKFKEALSLGFTKAQEVLATNLSESPHFVLNIYLQIGIGECALRSGDLKKAQKILQEVIGKGELLLGKNCPLVYAPKVLLMEALIRLNKLDDAEKLLSGILGSQTDNTVYSNFMECLFYYNALVLYSSRGNKIKKHEYFIIFAQKIASLHLHSNSLFNEKKELLYELTKRKVIDNNALSICNKLLKTIYPNITFIQPSLIKE